MVLTRESELLVSVASSDDTASEEITASVSDVDVKRNDLSIIVSRSRRVAKKLAAAVPYNFFLTSITDSVPTHSEPLSITFQELLDPCLGELECSVQIIFCLNAGWLLKHYALAGYEDVPLLILYEREKHEMDTISTIKPNVTAVKIKLPDSIGLHHTKMGLYGYRDGSMRVVISTANLIEDDWDNRTQGLWISPRLPLVPEGSDTTYGESRTDFRTSLLMYLEVYQLPQLQPWLARISKTDFSDVNVFLIASVPGDHDTNTPNGPLWGHPRVGHVLSQHAAPIDDSCPLVAQSSAVGSYGPSPKLWIQGEFMTSFGRDSVPKEVRRLPGFRFIFPTYSYVCQSYDGIFGANCLPYREEVHRKQKWLVNFLYQWVSRARHRDRTIPHIKTYCRWSASQGLQWFLLTSGNFSKSAWGYDRPDKRLHINNYEAGVLFLPKIVLDEDFFPMHPNGKHPPFPMPYDVPIIPYAPGDTPFFINYLLDDTSD